MAISKDEWLIRRGGASIACHSPLCIQINNIPKSRKINGRQKVENSSYFRKIVYTVIGEKVINKWILLYARIQFKEVFAKVFYCLENAFQQQKGYIGIKCGLRFLSSPVQWVPTQYTYTVIYINMNLYLYFGQFFWHLHLYLHLLYFQTLTQKYCQVIRWLQFNYSIIVFFNKKIIKITAKCRRCTALSS